MAKSKFREVTLGTYGTFEPGEKVHDEREGRFSERNEALYPSVWLWGTRFPGAHTKCLGVP